MSLFKKFANYCRSSNNAADARNRASPQRKTEWVLEACSTCYYLRDGYAIEAAYHPFCYYCEKRGIYIHEDVINERKCDQFLHE